MVLSFAVAASAMSYSQAREQALFLTDKMAYELNLTDDQYEAAYEINLDYLLSVNSDDELYGDYWRWRNIDFSYVLLDWQYRMFCEAAYFYRPLYFSAGVWHFAIYARYPHRDYFYFNRPTVYVSYRGGTRGVRTTAARGTAAERSVRAVVAMPTSVCATASSAATTDVAIASRSARVAAVGWRAEVTVVSARAATTAEAVSARAVRRDLVQVVARQDLVQAAVRALVQIVVLGLVQAAIHRALAVVRVARAQRCVSPRAIEALQAAASARAATTRRARHRHAQRSNRRARQEAVVLARADNL